MQRKLPISGPLLVLSALILAAMACYSDSPILGVELTSPPPSPTFLPTGQPDSYTVEAKFAVGDTVTALEQGANLRVSEQPEPITNLNVEGSCELGDSYQVLYAGYTQEEIEDDDTGDISLQENVYYLIDCRGTVGWVSQHRITGPISFPNGSSALTRAIDVRGNPINNDIYNIHDQNTEPVPGQGAPFGPPLVQCSTNEVVDVNGLIAVGEAEFWYRIRCQNGRIGWVSEDRLFGPLVLPDQGGTGLVDPEVASIDLFSQADGDETVGTCPGDSLITTQALEVIDEVPYYDIVCEDGNRGWTSQENIFEVPFAPGSFAVVYVEPIEEEATTEDEAVADDDTDAGVDGETGEDEIVVLTLPIAENPGFPGDDNPQVGECPSETIVAINDVTVVNERFSYSVDCGDAGSGWIDQEYVAFGTNFPLDIEVAILEEGFLSGSQTAFFIGSTPTLRGVRASSDNTAVGRCEPDTSATIIDGVFAQETSGLYYYYQIRCTSTRGEEIEGWVDQSRLFPADLLEDSGDDSPSTEIFGS